MTDESVFATCVARYVATLFLTLKSAIFFPPGYKVKVIYVPHLPRDYSYQLTNCILYAINLLRVSAQLFMSGGVDLGRVFLLILGIICFLFSLITFGDSESLCYNMVIKTSCEWRREEVDVSVFEKPINVNLVWKNIRDFFYRLVPDMVRLLSLIWLCITRDAFQFSVTS